MEDPYGEIEQQCHISSSQEDTLSLCPFALEDHFPPSDDDDDDNNWPEFSSPSGDPPNTNNDNIVGITICSAPETPEPQNDVATTSQTDEFKTPPEVSVPATLVGSNDAVLCADCSDLGFAVEERRCDKKREKEEEEEEAPIEPPLKKLKVEGANLGFMDSTQKGEGDGTEVVVVSSDDDEESEEEREKEEKSKTGDGGDTEEIEDVDDGDKDEISGKLNSNLEANAEGCKEDRMMKCLLDLMRAVAAREGGREKGNDEEKVDILETAKLRGMTFPRNRWYEHDPK